MSLRKPLLLGACMLSFWLGGCGNACRDLAAQICGCLPDDGTRAACDTKAQQTEGTFPVRAEDEKFCQQKLDSNSCSCAQLSTPEGKVGCGIAYTP
jgi:hypothetical protein